jgi:hypothetical protein
MHPYSDGMILSPCYYWVGWILLPSFLWKLEVITMARRNAMMYWHYHHRMMRQVVACWHSFITYQWGKPIMGKDMRMEMMVVKEYMEA